MIQLLSLLIIGLSIGWLAGLSVSPVIATILSSLVGIAGGIVAGARSLSRENSSGSSPVSLAQVDARPAALLVLGIALAAPLGILARTSGLFEPSEKASSSAPADQGVLFGVNAVQCEELRAMDSFPNERIYRTRLANSGDWGRLLEAQVTDTPQLKSIVEAICSKDE